MKIDCSCTISAGAIIYCATHEAAFSMTSSLAKLEAADITTVTKRQQDHLSKLEALHDTLVTTCTCVVLPNGPYSSIQYCPSHQAAYSIVGRVIEITDGDQVTLAKTITDELVKLAPAVDAIRFEATTIAEEP